MDDPLVQLGVGGLLAFLIIKEVLGFLNKFLDKRKNGRSSEALVKLVCNPTPEILNMVKQVDELLRLHDVKDVDGVPIWYVRHSLEKAIAKLSEHVEKQTHMLEKLVVHLKQNGTS